MDGYISIAIDGPSGVGKSTVAKRLARRLGFNYIDTGAMFRTISVLCLDKGLELTGTRCDEEQLINAAAAADIGVRYIEGVQHMFLDGEDVTGRLRTEEVSRISSVVSACPFVRERVLELERALAESSNVIMDGRDIGTVVLPDASLKIFLTASSYVRAGRRYKELKDRDMLEGAGFDEVLSDLEARDRRDCSRSTAPLKAAEDALVIDTSNLTIDEVEMRILEELKSRVPEDALTEK